MKFLLILTGCFFLGYQFRGQDGLPATRTNDFSLNYDVDGGMRYYSENLLISKDSCIYDKNNGSKKIKNKFSLSKPEMDALYDMLKQNKFGKIEFRTEEEVYDRGGISIRTSWDKGKKELDVSNAQRSFVKDKWSKEWQAICSNLTALVQKKTADL